MLKTSQKLLQFGLSSLATVTLGSVYCDRSYALSGFTGGYDPSKFTLTNNGANTDGSVDTTNAATVTGTVILTGGDNGSGDPGTTDWVIPINIILNPNQAGSGSFDWSYTSLDTPPGNDDEAGFLINNVFSPLSNTDGDSSLVPVIFIVDNTVTSLGLRVTTTGNFGGAGVLTISNFNFVPVPFEFSPALGLVSLGAFAVYKSLRKKK